METGNQQTNGRQEEEKEEKEESLFQKGKRLYEEGSYGDAIMALDRVAPDDQNYFAALTYLQAAWMAKDQPTMALRSAQRAIRIRPQSASAWFNLGVIAFKCDDLNQAQEAFESAVQYGHPKAGAELVKVKGKLAVPVKPVWSG